MLFYLCIILFLAFFSVGRIKGINENKIFAFAMLGLWFLATFRSLEIGNDTATYYNLFNSIRESGNYTYYIDRYEIGYLLINKWFTLFSDSFTLFLGVINAFIYYAYYCFINRFSHNKMFSAFLFLTLGFWGQTVNIIRLQIAIALIIYAYLLKESKKYVFAIIAAVSAVMFQRVSILYVLGVFIPKKLNKKFYIIGGVVSVASYVALARIISIVSRYVPYFNIYTNSRYSFGDAKLASIVGVAIRICVVILAIWTYKQNLYNNNDEELVEISEQINMVFVSMLILIASLNFNLLDRCGYFFWTYALALIPNSVVFQRNTNNRRILHILIVTVCVAYFMVINIYRPDWNHIYPYFTIFDSK